MKGKEYLEMNDGQVLGYTFVTIAYIALIGILMIKISAWWFLALFLWNWKWSKKN